MSAPPTSRSAFSLVEILVAVAVFGTVIVLVLAGLLFMVRGTMQNAVQDELDIDVQTSMERIKYDIRLSSLDKMFFYPPGPGPYTAISFPMARDDDGDGAIDKDADGLIIWDRTLVYHVWNGNPHQLRLTTFDPRDNDLTDAERQEQVNAVAVAGGGTGTHNGAHAGTQVVFENLFDWTISPRGAVVDGYAATETRQSNVGLGSCVLSSGTHQLTFTVLGKNDQSSGYRVGVDSLYASPSAGSREAEGLLPASAYSGPVPARVYMPGGSWDGNYQLLFAATQAGQNFTVLVDNDRWEMTNFQQAGDYHHNTEVVFDRSFNPYDYVVSLRGQETNWTAAAQTGSELSTSTASGQFRGTCVRVILRGEEMLGGSWIGFDGRRSKVLFRTAPNHPMTIMAASIAETANPTNNTMDAASATMHNLTFSGHQAVAIAAGASAWSDEVDLAVARTNSYLVTYLIDSDPASGTPWAWIDAINPSLSTTFVVPASSAPDAGTVASGTWSTRGDVAGYPAVVGVEALYSTYPADGYYISNIFDTHCDTPPYTEIRWNAQVPAGTDARLKVRTGNDPDLADAPAWDTIAAVPLYGVIDPGHGRYVQFLAELYSDSAGQRTPKLKDVTVKWTGAEQVVDIGGTFTKGPNYGIVKLTADGKDIVTGVAIDLEIFKEAPGYIGRKMMTSRLSAEIQPRNTGL